MNESLQVVHALIKESRQLSARQDLRAALGRAAEACERAEALDDHDVAVVDARTAAWAERALVLQRAGGASRARAAYMAAERAARKLPTDSARPHHRLQLATVLINLSGLLAKQRIFDEAREKVDEAIEIIRSMIGGGTSPEDPIRLLLLGALQNRATVEVEVGRAAEAEPLLREAVEIGAALMTGGAPQILPQVVDCAGRLSTVQRIERRWSDAITTAERAARWAEAAHEAGSPYGVALYVSTQIALVDAHFGSGTFAQGEDHLWKAVEASGTPDTMLVGTGFYLSLLRKPDEELSGGGLPRPEVVEALEELLGRLESAGATESMMMVIRARYAVMVDGRRDHGERVLRSPPPSTGSDAGVVRQLLSQLRSDVEWGNREVESGS